MSAVQSRVNEVDGVVRRALNERGLAGLAVAVVVDGDIAWTGTYGMADVAEQRPVETPTVFRVGSISKTLTAIGLLQLCEEGRFDLDDSANSHLRTFKLQPAGTGFPTPTIRELLTHRGGIGEVRGLADVLRPTLGLGVPVGERVPSLGEYYGSAVRVAIAPGTKWAYANHAYAVLGQLIEDVTGEPWAERLRSNVLAPLGMGDSDYLRSDRVAARLARGYRPGRRGVHAVKDREIVPGPAGSLFSTVTDMARYASALLRGGSNEHGSVLKPETLASMFAPQYRAHPLGPAIGLSFLLSDVAGHRVAGHDGGWPGFISRLTVAPDDGVGVVALTNGGSPWVGVIADRVLRHLLAVAEQPWPSDVPERPDVWENLVGFYRVPKGLRRSPRPLFLTGGTGLEVTVSGGHLVARALAPVPALARGVRLHPVSSDDPTAFVADLGSMGILPVTFDVDGDRPARAVQVGVAMPALERGAELWNPRPWLAGAAAAGLAGRLLVRGIRR